MAEKISLEHIADQEPLYKPPEAKDGRSLEPLSGETGSNYLERMKTNYPEKFQTALLDFAYEMGHLPALAYDCIVNPEFGATQVNIFESESLAAANKEYSSQLKEPCNYEAWRQFMDSCELSVISEFRNIILGSYRIFISSLPQLERRLLEQEEERLSRRWVSKAALTFFGKERGGRFVGDFAGRIHRWQRVAVQSHANFVAVLVKPFMEHKPFYSISIKDMWECYYSLSSTVEDLGMNEEILGHFLTLIKQDHVKEVGEKKETET